ncbi:MAG: RluA family pseudouridine synthase [Clostridia bacterium]|nr:RluA family pseudouridine synthase [Clostridia bacterium]
MKTIIVGKNDENQRLDKFLGKLIPDVPMSVLYKSLRKKRVKVNGKRVTDGSLRLCAGDSLDLYLNDELFGEKPTGIYQSLTPDLQVVYEDGHILVMDKPWGMLSQSETEESLEGHMRAYLMNKGEFCPEGELTFLPSLCHRIDRNTDGLVIGAKDAESLRILNEKIKNREIRKFYLCELEDAPRPEQGEIRLWMKKDQRKNKMELTHEGDGDAVFCHTRYRVLKKGKPALVEAELLTGRTHQIRAGFGSLGCPLVGDVKYGAEKNGRRFQHLTAKRLVFSFVSDAGILQYLNGKEIVLPDRKGEKYASMDNGTQ